jgi:Fic family protein
MAFQARVDGYTGTKRYNDAEELYKTLELFINEASKHDTISFTLFDFDGPKNVTGSILNYLKKNTGEFDAKEITKSTGAKLKSVYNALMTLYKKGKINKIKVKGKGIVFSYKKGN